MFKWIVRQPMNALRFVARHGKTKMGRLAMTVIATTVADKAGMPGAAEMISQAPELAQGILCNPTMAAIGLFGMLHRDGDLKKRFNH